MGTKMNLIDFEVKRSKVTVTMRPSMLNNYLFKMHLSGKGIPVDSLLSKLPYQ